MLFWPPLYRARADGCLKDALNGGIQHGVKLRIGLLGREALDERSREAGHLLASIAGYRVKPRDSWDRLVPLPESNPFGY